MGREIPYPNSGRVKFMVVFSFIGNHFKKIPSWIGLGYTLKSGHDFHGFHVLVPINLRGSYSFKRDTHSAKYF